MTLRILGAVAALLLLLPAGLFALGELTGEVVVLTTRDASGGTHTTRLWIVEDEGRLWLRAGGRAQRSSDSWLARLRATPSVELRRGDETRAYLATVIDGDPARRERVDGLMARDYALANRLVVGMARRRAGDGEAGGSVPIRLDPVEP